MKEAKASLRERGGLSKKAVRLYQWQAGIGDFHTTGKNLDHGSGTGQVKILMNDGVRHQFTDCQIREHRHLLAQSLTDDLVTGQQVGNKADQTLEACSVALAAFLLAYGFDPAFSL